MVTFRPLRRSDFPTLAVWFGQPHVERWWHEPTDPAAIEAKYGPRVDGREPTTMWIVEVGGEAAGLAQHYLHADQPDHDRSVGIDDAVGIDYLLADGFAGRGIGPRMLEALARLALAEEQGAACCVATPAQDNRPSWRALERAGFVRRASCTPPDEPPAWAYSTDRAALVDRARAPHDPA